MQKFTRESQGIFKVPKPLQITKRATFDQQGIRTTHEEELKDSSNLNEVDILEGKRNSPKNIKSFPTYDIEMVDAWNVTEQFKYKTQVFNIYGQ